MSSAAGTTLPLVLGSSSKWRRMLFRDCFPDRESTFSAPDIDEKAIRRDDPSDLTLAIAHAKMDKLVEMSKTDDTLRNTVIVASDQVTVWQGVVREKPVDKAEARHFLSTYGPDAPATHVTAVVAYNTVTGTRAAGVDIAVLHFNKITDDAINALIAKGTCRCLLVSCFSALLADGVALFHTQATV